MAGRPEVTEVRSYCDDEYGALALAAAAEQASDHPLARAIVRYAASRGRAAATVTDVETHKGMGIEGVIGGKRVLVGNKKLMDSRGVELTPGQEEDIPARQRQSATTVLAAVDGRLCLLIAVSDALKPDAAVSIARLRRLGVKRIAMLTGDNRAAAEAVAARAGITEIYPECLPQDKVSILRRMQEEGCTVTFVGDGINDSPAITAADTGIAMGSGTDVAVESSDVVLISSDLAGLASALALAKRTEAVMYQNIAIAVGTVALLLIGLFAGFVHMSIGMLIHEASILVVIFNAMRLLFLKGE